MKRFLFFSFLVFLLISCTPQTETVEVTRIVESTIEVTRIVEVTREIEVTRLVEPTLPPTPEAPPCEDYIADVENLVLDWSDGFELALSTPRASLSGPIASLQEIRSNVRDIDSSSCGEIHAVHEKLFNYTDAGVDIFIEFAASEDTNVEFASYSINSDLFFDALEALKNNSELPQRVHYYAFGLTGFEIRYTDSDGNIVSDESENSSVGRFGFDEHPVVRTAIIPTDGEAMIELFNLAGQEDVTCFLLLNGEPVDEQTGGTGTKCELP